MNKNVRLLSVALGLRLMGFAMIFPFVSIYLNQVAGYGLAEVGVLIVLISIVPLAFSPLGGLITDRTGRRVMILSGLGGEAASIFLVALSMQYGWVPGVLAGGALAGVAGSLAQPAIQAYVADVTEVAERTMAYTWVRIGFNGGFTIGVLVGSAVLGLLGFPDTAFLTSAILAVGVLFIFFTVGPSPYDVALSSGRAPASEPLPAPPSVRDSFRTLLKDRTFLVLCLASLFGGLLYGNWSFTFPLFTKTILLATSFSSPVAYLILGVALALNGVIVIFGQIPMTKMMAGRTHTHSFVLAMVMMVLSFLAIGGFSLVAGGELIAVFSFVVLLTIGENLGAIPSMTLPSNVAPATEIGNYNSVFGLFNGMGNTLTPLFAGFVLASVGNYLAVWTILAIPAVPGILLMRAVGRKIPKAQNTI